MSTFSKTATPTDTLNIGQIVRHDFGIAVNWADAAFKIVVANDSFLPAADQAILADVLAALEVAKNFLATH